MPTKGKRNKENIDTGKNYHQEIIILLTLSVCILLFISNFGIGGIFGDWISSILFGVFGLIAYIIPILIFGLVVFGLSNRGNRQAWIKMIACFVLLLMIVTLIELISNPYNPELSLGMYYNNSSMFQNGGGFLAGTLILLFVPLIGLPGTYMISIILGLICLILITERSLLKPLGKTSKKAYEGVAMKKRHYEERKQTQCNPRKTSTLPLPSQMQVTEPKKKRGMQEIKPLDLPTDEFDHTEASVEVIVDMPIEDTPTVDTPYKKSRKSTKTQAKQKEEQREQTSNDKAEEINTQSQHTDTGFLPSTSLLTLGEPVKNDVTKELQATAKRLEQILNDFGVEVTVTDFSCGPTVTRFEIQPKQGVKVSRIVALQDDIKLNLAVADLRIEAPIPGKAAVGIEVPNVENSTVTLRELLESKEFKTSKSMLSFAVGKDLSGKVVVRDIARMPHLLVAGATGSGKSVCINTLIMSILYKATPKDVRLIMIDPKVVELSIYKDIPHLLLPVVTDPKKAVGALNWAVAEMTRRYQLFADANVRDINGYNDLATSSLEIEDKPEVTLPKIVVIVDELADLMMVASSEVETAICRLAQLARAAGIHLIIATQRPSVNVITGLIKANMPSRIAFAVSASIDSRVILDMNGAEKLLGKGDMLFYPSGIPKPMRVQGSFVSDEDVRRVVEEIKRHATPETEAILEEQQSLNTDVENITSLSLAQESNDGRDPFFADAGRLIIEKDKASIGMLQRMFRIGFNRASRIMEQLYETGCVSGEEGTKPRNILMTLQEFETLLNEIEP